MPDFREDIRARLASLGIVPASEADVVDELAQHLEDEYREQVAGGATDREARASALATVTDELEAMRGTGRIRGHQVPAAGMPAGSWIAGFWQDLRFAGRILRLRPGFTTAAVTLVALGIAASATIFSVVNTVLLEPLPFPRSDRLITYWGTAPDMGLPKVDAPDLLFSYQRQHTQALESVAAYDGASMTVLDGGDPARIDGAWISHNFFTVMAVPPALGRAFTRDEERPNGGLVVILSDALWRQRFGADSAIIGKSIRINDLPNTVVGVMPPGFEFPGRSRLWVPLRLTGQSFNCWCFELVARLRDGQTVETARLEMERLTDDLALSRPDVFTGAKRGGSRVVAMDLTTRLAGDVRTPLIVLLVSVGLVLLIGCANVANLMLARAAQRTRELAVRCALGASPRRIRSQLMTEAGLILLFGLAAGMLAARWSLGVIRTLPADRIPRIDQIAIDPAVLMFGIATALLAGLVVAVVPAFRASRVDLQASLRDGARGSRGAGNRRTSDAFVVVQLALSLVLLTGAGLMIRSFGNLMDVDAGYRVQQVLTAQIALPSQRYPTDTVVRQFMRQAIERVEAIPGVTRVGLVSRPPLTPGNAQNGVFAEGQEPRPNEPTMVANVRFVTPGYFEAIGTPIIAGRGITSADRADAPRVAVVDESMVRRYWPNENPLGKRIRHGTDPARHSWFTIVGVVPNIKHSGLDEDASLQVYEPFEQQTVWSMYFVVRSAGTPESLIPPMRAAIAGLDGALPLFNISTMESALARTLVPRRLTNNLLIGFAAAAVLLAAIGVYGVMSLNVNARFREFGVRLALGAAPGQVMRMVLRGGARLALAGVVSGTVAAALLTPMLGDLLFGVSPRDVRTFVVVAILLMTFAAVACFLPARRAMRADPTEALRAD